MFSDLGLECTNGAYYYVTGINYGYNDSETMLNNLKKYIESHNHIVVGPDIEGTLRLSSIVNKNPGQLNNPEVTITKKAEEPCAYGVLIHSMWGEEDKVFEEYKRINNLML